MNNSPARLPNLDAIRAIAALLVFVWHTELIKAEFGFFSMEMLHDLGGVGVTIFFVLSGFLITYLLLKEHDSNGKVNLTKFYFRRILRIWPLYFLILFIGVLFIPGGMSLSAFLMSIFFLPNIAFVLGKLPALIDPIWSLGVEEQFYIFHPHFFRKQKVEKILNSMIIAFVLFYLFKMVVSHFHIEILQKIFFFARFDCMLLGAIFSVWFFNYLYRPTKFKTWISPRIFFTTGFQIFLLFGFVNYLLFSIVVKTIPYNNQFFSFIVASLIVNLAFNRNCIFSLENKFLNFIGKISFGLYLIHKFPVLLFTWLAHQLQITSFIYQNLFIYGLALPVAIGLAYLIFQYYESYFLKIKDKKYSVH
jgi:peptidoglycan/LPS O-acetylase OafA/YrhL